MSVHDEYLEGIIVFLMQVSMLRLLLTLVCGSLHDISWLFGGGTEVDAAWGNQWLRFIGRRFGGFGRGRKTYKTNAVRYAAVEGSVGTDSKGLAGWLAGCTGQRQSR